MLKKFFHVAFIIGGLTCLVTNAFSSSDPWNDLIADAPQNVRDLYQRDITSGKLVKGEEEQRVRAIRKIYIPNNPEVGEEMYRNIPASHHALVRPYVEGLHEVDPYAGSLGEINQTTVTVRVTESDVADLGWGLMASDVGTDKTFAAAELTIRCLAKCSSWGGNLGQSAQEIYRNHREPFIQRLEMRLKDRDRLQNVVNTQAHHSCCSLL